MKTNSDSLSLRDLQTLMGRSIMLPLTENEAINPLWSDGRATSVVASTFIKPNDRLTSVERLEIYNKQYWYRLIDCLYDDFPGLRAVLGEKKFNVLVLAYLKQFPSRSFSLRNLGSHLPEFVEKDPYWSKPFHPAATQMARFEWAQIIAFDNPSWPRIDPLLLAQADPETLILHIQPYITLLSLDYPLDDFILELKRKETDRSEASVGERPHSDTIRRRKLPPTEKVFLAVHRFNNRIFYKRMSESEYTILHSLSSSTSLGESVERSIEFFSNDSSEGDFASALQTWFASWNSLGWFCTPPESDLQDECV